MEFLRGQSQEKFLDGSRRNMERAEAARLITADHRTDISNRLPGWYDFMEDRGVKKGDTVVYWVHGDTLRTTYRGPNGQVFLDRLQVGRRYRYGFLGGYFAPGSEFRRQLVQSLLNRE
jgi:hypothetical protein